MRWRPLAALTETRYTTTDGLPVYTHLPEDFSRSAELAEALARLEAATRLRDGDAVARILDGLAASEDGQWLLRQCVAAGLREVAAVIAEADTSAANRSFGAA
jgi:hypothetical protein